MTYAAIIARRRVPAFGGVGIDTRQEAAHVASHYLYFRNRRGMTAQAALEAARALPAVYTAGREYYPSCGAGAATDNGMRWLEDSAAMGFRFVGDACDLVSYGRGLPTGYYTDAEGDYQTLRAGVWQLPGKGRHARLVAGYREFDGDKETNAGTARLDLSQVWLVDMSEAFGNLDEMDGTRDAARCADGLAEHEAEEERAYNVAYEAGRKAAEMDAEALEARKEALTLLADMRARFIPAERSGPVWKALLSRVHGFLETISEKREARNSAWGDCPSWREEAWISGFMDESEGGFARAVRLGYAKAGAA